jgi:DNA-binding beta-propeller fold protein YncE
MHLFPAVAVGLAALSVTSSARAGGVPVELAASGRTVWAVSDSGLSAVDTRTGVSSTGPRTPYPYATRLAVSHGAVWVASIANGYVSGAVSRIDARTHRAETMLRLQRRPVWDVCAGGGVVWAIFGSGDDPQLARLNGATRFRAISLRTQTVWCVADRRGAWITTADGRLLHVDARTAAVTTAAHIHGAFSIAAGAGRVWVSAGGAVASVDERTSRVQRFATGGTVDAIAVGTGHVWLLTRRGGRSSLLKIDPTTGRVESRRRLPGSPTAVLASGGRVWIGGLDAGRIPTLWRADPETLVARRVATL